LKVRWQDDLGRSSSNMIYSLRIGLYAEGAAQGDIPKTQPSDHAIYLVAIFAGRGEES
jgi:hypothetical protein